MYRTIKAFNARVTVDDGEDFVVITDESSLALEKLIVVVDSNEIKAMTRTFTTPSGQRLFWGKGNVGFRGFKFVEKDGDLFLLSFFCSNSHLGFGVTKKRVLSLFDASINSFFDIANNRTEISGGLLVKI